MAINLVVAPVGLLLLVGAILLVWWLAKQAPGWVVALLGGGLVLMVGFAALLLMAYTRTESRVRVAHDNQQQALQQAEAGAAMQRSMDEQMRADRQGRRSRPMSGDSRDGSTIVEKEGGAGSAIVEKEGEFPYRGRPTRGRAQSATVWGDMAIFGVLAAVVGLALVVGLITLSIYLVKKNPGWIVLPIFGTLGLLVVGMGLLWMPLASHESGPAYPTVTFGEASTDVESTEMRLETRYEVNAPASGGTVTKILVRHKATVKEGEVLLRLENQKLAEARREKLTAIAETDKQVKELDGDESKKAELERTQSAQQAELDAIDRQITFLEIKSPAAGRVVGQNLHSKLGQILKPGEVILHVFESKIPSTGTPSTGTPIVGTPVAGTDVDRDTPVEVAKAAPPATPKPLWVEKPNARVKGVDQRMVVIGPYTDDPDLPKYDAVLNKRIHEAVDEYVRGILGVKDLGQFRVPNRFIFDNIIKDQWYETRSYNFGVLQEPMTQKHLLLAFDQSAKGEILEMYRQKQLERRLGFAGFGSCLLLMLIGTVYGYLKLDTQTKGYYSGRLKLAAAAVILAVALLAVMLSTGGIIS